MALCCLRRRRKKKMMRVRRTTAAAEPVAIPAIVPLLFCCSGVMMSVGLLEESWAVGGGLVAEFDVGIDVDVDVGVVLDVDVDDGVGVGVGIGVVEGRVVSVVGRDVGRDMSDDEKCDFSGRLVNCEDEKSDIGLAVYLDVGRSLSFEDVGLLFGLEIDVVIWSGEREVGLGVSTLVVANISCVTTLNPASMEDATSAGSAESSTERAFCGSSCGREFDMVSVGPLSKVARFSISEAACSTATMI
jgi:hypothetical protein